MKFQSGRAAVVNPQSSISIDDVTVEFVNEYKYLGYILTNNGYDVKHITQLYHGLCARSNSIIRNFSKCDIDTKALLFRSFCTSFYGISLVFLFDLASMNKLRVCYNNSLRMMMREPRHCSASALFVRHSLPSFQELRRKAGYGLLQRLRASSNVIIKNIVTSWSFKQSAWYRTQQVLLSPPTRQSDWRQPIQLFILLLF